MLLETKFQFVCVALVAATFANALGAHSASLRGFGHVESQSHRLLPLHPAHHSSSSSGSGGGGGTSDYYGCLDLNTTEQEETWPDGPTCDYAVDTEGNSTVTEYEVVDDDISSNPYGDFVISECNTYESLWRWDLHMSCGSDNTNLDSCNCTFAEELFDKGLLVCEDRERCPRSCPICSTCLTILGCPDSTGPGNRLETSTIIYIIIGAVILLVVGLALFHSHRRKNQKGDLNQQLISDADNSKGMVDPHRDDQAGFQPPLVDSGDGAALVSSAAIAGGIAGGLALKSSNDNDSDSETDDCEESLDATVPAAEESMADLSAGGLIIPVVRSEEEDAAPEDEKEATDEMNGEAQVPQPVLVSGTMESVASNDTADIGAVRSAFLHSLENESSESNDAEDTEDTAAHLDVDGSSGTDTLGEEGTPTAVEEGSHGDSLENSDSWDSANTDVAEEETEQECADLDSSASNESPADETTKEDDTVEPTEDALEEDGAVDELEAEDNLEPDSNHEGEDAPEPFDEGA